MGDIGDLLGGVASGIGGIASSLIGAKSQRDTNRQNKELFERSLAWQEDMWNKSNAYNDPSAQSERLLKAGINPAFVLGNGSMAEAGTMSAPSAPQLQAYDYGRMGDAVANGVNTYFNSQIAQSQAKKNSAEAAKTDLEAFQLEKELPSMIEYWQQKAKNEGVTGDIARNNLYFLQAVQGQRISQVFGDTRLQSAQIKQANLQAIGIDFDNRLKNVQLAYAPYLNQAQLDQYAKVIQQLSSVIKLNAAQAGLAGSQAGYYGELSKSEAVKRMGEIINNGMKAFDFQFRQKTFDTSVAILTEDLYNKQATTSNIWSNTYLTRKKSHLSLDLPFGSIGLPSSWAKGEYYKGY